MIWASNLSLAGQIQPITWFLQPRSHTHNNVFYKAALAETISWEGHLTGTYDVLLQSVKGTKRLTLVKDRDGEHWNAGDEVEQIGIISQEVVDLLAAVIKEVRS